MWNSEWTLPKWLTASAEIAFNWWTLCYPSMSKQLRSHQIWKVWRKVELSNSFLAQIGQWQIRVSKKNHYFIILVFNVCQVLRGELIHDHFLLDLKNIYTIFKKSFNSIMTYNVLCCDHQEKGNNFSLHLKNIKIILFLKQILWIINSNNWFSSFHKLFGGLHHMTLHNLKYTNLAVS